jgi:lipopolysaccharide transport system permease protein
MMDPAEHSDFHVISAKKRRSLASLFEIPAYADLLRFLVLRSIKVRYAQSVLGFGWAIIQPLMQMFVFTIIFGTLIGVKSDGENYAVFAFTALVPWTYFSNALTQATSSLTANANLISKIYFPRLILPLSEVSARLIDFLIGMVMLFIMLLVYGVAPSPGWLLVPVLVIIMIMTAAGAAFWLSALSVQYRDVNYASTFMVQILMYASPVVYSVNIIPADYQRLYALNPMVGVIDGFRSALLGSAPHRLDLIAIGAVVSLILFVSGAIYFQRRQHIFADVG